MLNGNDKYRMNGFRCENICTKQLNGEWFNLSAQWVCQVPLHASTLLLSVDSELSNWIWFNVARIAAHYTLEISQISRTASNYLFLETMHEVPASHSRHQHNGVRCINAGRFRFRDSTQTHARVHIIAIYTTTTFRTLQKQFFLFTLYQVWVYYVFF